MVATLTTYVLHNLKSLKKVNVEMLELHLSNRFRWPWIAYCNLRFHTVVISCFQLYWKEKFCSQISYVSS